MKLNNNLKIKINFNRKLNLLSKNLDVDDINNTSKYHFLNLY